MVDADGFLKITGRTKEIINRGGVKFNPVEVEEILMAVARIQQCAGVPVPDEALGERGCLCVELVPGASLTLEDVTKFSMTPESQNTNGRSGWPFSTACP